MRRLYFSVDLPATRTSAVPMWTEKTPCSIITSARGKIATAMTDQPLFEAAFPFADDVLNLPVEDIDQTVSWYKNAFNLTEVERRETPVPTVILQRDGVQIGFAINGGDADNDGAAILVTDIHRARDEIESRGIEIGNWRIDERDGEKLQVFFVIAPDRLCYYFHQPLVA